VDRQLLVGLSGAEAVYRLADDVHKAPQRIRPHRYDNRATGIVRGVAADQAVDRPQRDTAHLVLAQFLRNLGRKDAAFPSRDFYRVADGR
jgi:hypothetical protein